MERAKPEAGSRMSGLTLMTRGYYMGPRACGGPHWLRRLTARRMHGQAFFSLPISRAYVCVLRAWLGLISPVYLDSLQSARAPSYSEREKEIYQPDKKGCETGLRKSHHSE